MLLHNTVPGLAQCAWTCCCVLWGWSKSSRLLLLLQTIGRLGNTQHGDSIKYV